MKASAAPAEETYIVITFERQQIIIKHCLRDSYVFQFQYGLQNRTCVHGGLISVSA